MDREDIIARLRENEAALRARGVTHAALFGSRARGDARADSDTDIMIEIDPEAPVTIYELCGDQGLHRRPVRWTGRCRGSGGPQALRATRNHDGCHLCLLMRRRQDAGGSTISCIISTWRKASWLAWITSFSSRSTRVYGVIRCLEIISEASRRLPDELKAGIRRSNGKKWLLPATFIAMSTRMLPSVASGAPSVALPPLHAVVEGESHQDWNASAKGKSSASGAPL